MSAQWDHDRDLEDEVDGEDADDARRFAEFPLEVPAADGLEQRAEVPVPDDEREV